MKLRLLKQNGKLFIYCLNGTIMAVDDDALIKLLTSFDKPHLFKGTDGVWNKHFADMSEVVGETLAYVDDTKKLVVLNNNVFSGVLKETKQYVSVTEYAKMHGKCRASVKNMCKEGRIEGIYKTSSGWLIPSDAPYPPRKNGVSDAQKK